jgi:hypothetical protein
MSSIAVPEVIPSINRFNSGCVLSAEADRKLEASELDAFELPFAFACNASRYLCPTGVRTRPFGAGMKPFIANTIVE